MSVDESISKQVYKEVCITCLKFANDGHQEELISLSTRLLVNLSTCQLVNLSTCQLVYYKI